MASDAISDEERSLINETIKAYTNMGHCLTPEAIWGFLQANNEPVALDKVFAIYQEVTQKTIKE